MTCSVHSATVYFFYTIKDKAFPQALFRGKTEPSWAEGSHLSFHFKIKTRKWWKRRCPKPKPGNHTPTLAMKREMNDKERREYMHLQVQQQHQSVMQIASTKITRTIWRSDWSRGYLPFLWTPAENGPTPRGDICGLRRQIKIVLWGCVLDRLPFILCFMLIGSRRLTQRP